MKNERKIKTFGEHMKCESIDKIERLDSFYFNLTEVIQLFSITRSAAKKVIDYNNTRIVNGELYIDQYDLKKLALVSCNEAAIEYLNDVVCRDNDYHWYGYNIDEYIIENEDVEDVLKYKFNSHLYNDCSSAIKSKNNNITTDNIDDQIFIQCDDELNTALDGIYEILSCDEHNINE